MDIAAASIQMHLSSAQQGASVAVMRKAMDGTAVAAEQLISQLQAANPAPAFGHQMDFYA